MPTPGKCSGFKDNSEISWNFFAGHKILGTGLTCWEPFYVAHFTFTKTPVIKLPTRYPGGGLTESVTLTDGPDLSYETAAQIRYRFTIRQCVLKLACQNFVFDWYYDLAHGERICAVHRACTDWVPRDTKSLTDVERRALQRL